MAKALINISPNRRPFWFITAVVTFVYMLFKAVPWHPYSLPSTIDYSWELAINYAALAGKQFGSEIVYTFGPLGYLYQRSYYPSLFFWTIVYWVFFAIVNWWAQYRWSRRMIKNPFWVLIWMVCSTSICCFHSDGFFFSLLFLFMLQYYFVDTELPATSIETVILSIALGVVALVKFTLCMATIWVLGFVTIDQLLRKRIVPYPLLYFTISLIAMWLLTGQHLASLMSYCTSSQEIARGYSEAMSIPSGSSDLINSVVTAIALSCFLWDLLWRRVKGWTLITMPAFLGIFLIVIKAAYVRPDAGHVLIACFSLAFPAFAILPLYFAENSGGLRRLLVSIFVALVLCISVPRILSLPAYSFPLYVFDQIARAYSNFEQSRKVISGKGDYDASFEEHMASIREQDPLPKLKGTVDIYPVEIESLIANKADYDPRPVLQSYQSYTPPLMEMDAAHLRGSKAPQWIIFRISPKLNYWLPSLDSSLSWTELLSRYDISSTAQNYLLLKRSSIQRSYKLLPLKTIQGQFDQPINLSSDNDQLLWASFDITLTPLGKLQNILYRIFPPEISLIEKNGTTKQYPSPSQMMKAGFLLSPHVEDKDSFSALYLKQWKSKLQSQKIDSVIISDPNNHSLGKIFEPTFTLKLFRLELSPNKHS
jgi:hypothetical protein